MDDVAVIILAAGKGTRMKSDLAKVLHRVAGKSMVNHVVEAALGVTRDHIHVVVGHQADRVQAEILAFHPAHFAYQEKLLGTGDAVKAALPKLAAGIRHVLVLCGDVPLIQKKTVMDVVAAHTEAKVELTVLAVEVADPTGYGRIIQGADGSLAAIREEADAGSVEKKIRLVNSGIYCFDRDFLESGIKLIRNVNNQAEYYLTDLVEIAVSKNAKTLIRKSDEPARVMGVNTLEELGQAEVLFDSAQNELPWLSLSNWTILNSEKQLYETMKLGNESIKNKFDDIEIRVDFLIELCRTLQDDNKILISKVETLEQELDKKSKTEEVYEERESMIQSKMDGLLTKLDGFANNISSEDLSGV